ncbi:MAG: LysM peptidoglycan-binding domain-containing protein [Pseudomonadota bacterium]
MGSSGLSAWLLGAGATIVVAGAAWVVLQDDPAAVLPAALTAPAETPAPEQPAEDTEVARAPSLVEEPAADAQAPIVEREAEIVADTEAEAEAEADIALTPPSFDTVRVEADGQALIAGQAAPGASVEIRLGGVALTTTQASADGRFAAFVTVPPSEDVQVMSLMSRLDVREAASLQTLLIEPVTAAEATATAMARVAEPELSEEIASEASTATASAEGTAPAVVAGLTDTSTQPATGEGAPAEVASDATVVAPAPKVVTAAIAPRVLLADEQGLRVVQDPEPAENVQIDTITYNSRGDVSVGGRGVGQGFVRIYLNGAPITTAPILEDGSWRTSLPEVDAGIYTLRVDEVSVSGTVTSRVETPFRREPPAVVAEVVAESRDTPAETGPIDEGVITVQPGATLWAIAREQYGDGVLYVKVFEANSDRIRDPNLIYPGQIFDLPD